MARGLPKPSALARPTPFDFGGFEAQKLFKGSGQRIIMQDQLPDAVKQQVVLSMLGMDRAYAVGYAAGHCG